MDRIPQWPRECDACGKLVHEWGKLRHPTCAPPRYRKCPDCGHLFDGVAMFVDHYKTGPEGRSGCDRLQAYAPRYHDVPMSARCA
jgi:hypothetical protein